MDRLFVVVVVVLRNAATPTSRPRMRSIFSERSRYANGKKEIDWCNPREFVEERRITSACVLSRDLTATSVGNERRNKYAVRGLAIALS